MLLSISHTSRNPVASGVHLELSKAHQIRIDLKTVRRWIVNSYGNNISFKIMSQNIIGFIMKRSQYMVDNADTSDVNWVNLA